MPPPLQAAIAGGATILTPGRRLARRIEREWDRQKKRAGFTVWTRPDVLPFGAWIERRWRDALYSGRATKPLLSRLQERLLWQRIIDESPSSSEVLRADAAAMLVSEAWATVHAWRIPLDDAAFESTVDTAAFRAWSRAYSEAPFLDSARLPDIVEPEGEGVLTGFDTVTPQQDRLCGAWPRLPAVEPAAGRAVRTALPNAEAELEAAAHWARTRLEGGAPARIGIVVPRLESMRAAAQRVFSAVLDPGGGSAPAFHIALGPPLAQWPAVDAALLALEAMQPRVSAATLSALLLTPWIAGAEEERGARAMFDARLRRDREPEPSRSYVSAHMHCPPRFRQLLEAAGKPVPAAQKPNAWSRDFSALLNAFGWPGGAPLASVEFQAIEAFRAALSQLGSLDIVSPAIPAGTALSLLRRICAESPFQPEDLGQPVQIMGLFDAVNELFDHLWITSFDDETWPRPPAPNPFLPLPLQRAHGVPRSSPEWELAFARRLTARLLEGAPEVEVSHAAAEGERDLQPSPLIAHLPFEPHAATGRAWYLAPAALETLFDTQAPPLPPDTRHSGGTRTLQLQAACPFRAFAELRLAARPLEAPPLGLDARDRGILLHDALKHCWSELGSQRGLAAVSPEELQALIGRSVARAIRDSLRRPASAFHERVEAIERRRLTALLASWLAIEKQRTVPFTVMPPEQPREIAIGGLQLRARIDRVDRFDDGRFAILDYKSTAPSLSAWDGDRPDEPQLPMYAVTSDVPLAAVAFAQVQTGDSYFRGFGEAPTPFDGLKPADMAALLEGWRASLHGLAEQFLNGFAPVEPKDRDKCAYCHLHSLCRIHEDE